MQSTGSLFCLYHHLAHGFKCLSGLLLIQWTGYIWYISAIFYKGDHFFLLAVCFPAPEAPSGKKGLLYKKNPFLLEMIIFKKERLIILIELTSLKAHQIPLSRKE